MNLLVKVLLRQDADTAIAGFHEDLCSQLMKDVGAEVIEASFRGETSLLLLVRHSGFSYFDNVDAMGLTQVHRFYLSDLLVRGLAAEGYTFTVADGSVFLRWDKKGESDPNTVLLEYITLGDNPDES